MPTQHQDAKKETSEVDLRRTACVIIISGRHGMGKEPSSLFFRVQYSYFPCTAVSSRVSSALEPFQ